MMVAINSAAPNWRELRIHESSPVARGTSARLQREAPGYISSFFFKDTVPGTERDGSRCENLEAQTFDSESFDLVLTQDVMEHLIDPATACLEIWRTLAPGGSYIFTTPIYPDLPISQRRVALETDGALSYLAAPEFHGDPVNEAGALVTFHYGHDLPSLVASWAPFEVEVRRFHDRARGILGASNDVLICRKAISQDR